jgi:hypothetical protein
MLYRLLKNVIQSSSVCFSLSSRSSQSGRTSSDFVDVRARAREASWPANTVSKERVVSVGFVVRELGGGGGNAGCSQVRRGKAEGQGTVVRAAFLVGLVPSYIEDFALVLVYCQPRPMWIRFGGEVG